MSRSDRRIAALTERVRVLEAGTEALRTVALRYGAHGPDCDTWEAGGVCNCEWETTRELIEKGGKK